MPACVALPPIFCGSSMMMTGRVAASTSMGRRLPKSSRSENMMSASLEWPPSFIDLLKFCVLMTMTEMSARWANWSISFRRALL